MSANGVVIRLKIKFRESKTLVGKDFNFKYLSKQYFNNVKSAAITGYTQ